MTLCHIQLTGERFASPRAHLPSTTTTATRQRENSLDDSDLATAENFLPIELPIMAGILSGFYSCVQLLWEAVNGSG